MAKLTNQERAAVVRSDDFQARFWAKVGKNPCDEDDCWIWLAGGNSQGYGTIRLGPKLGDIRAHVASWMIANGPVPEGLQVLHSCDNPGCVNPKHLFTGTHVDNMKDMKAKGRENYWGNKNM